MKQTSIQAMKRLYTELDGCAYSCSEVLRGKSYKPSETPIDVDPAIACLLDLIRNLLLHSASSLAELTFDPSHLK